MPGEAKTPQPCASQSRKHGRLYGHEPPLKRRSAGTRALRFRARQLLVRALLFGPLWMLRHRIGWCCSAMRRWRPALAAGRAPCKDRSASGDGRALLALFLGFEAGPCDASPRGRRFPQYRHRGGDDRACRAALFRCVGPQGFFVRKDAGAPRTKRRPCPTHRRACRTLPPTCWACFRARASP